MSKKIIAEISGHINQVERLIKTANHNLCDSGSGSCRLAMDLRASTPALEAALKELRQKKRRYAPIMDQEDAEQEV